MEEGEESKGMMCQGKGMKEVKLGERKGGRKVGEGGRKKGDEKRGREDGEEEGKMMREVGEGEVK